jgi:limonene-1,2-epoxide hydrolase
MEQIVATALDAIAEHDWDGLRRVLHPHLHWTGVDAVTVRGRNKVIAMLEHAGLPPAPAGIELRDEQIYRWCAALLPAGEAAERLTPPGEICSQPGAARFGGS